MIEKILTENQKVPASSENKVKPLYVEEVMASYTDLIERFPVISTKGLTPLVNTENGPFYVAGFTSNSGLIIDKALELQKHIESERGYSPFEILCLVSDNEKSKGTNAFFENRSLAEVARAHNIPTVVKDIDTFYRQKGYSGKTDPTMTKEVKMNLRKEFDNNLRTELMNINDHVDGIVLDYYWSLCSPVITSNYLTINSHLGDLSVKDENGNRELKGFYPVRKAIFKGYDEIRSTTHITDEKVDNGDILVRSRPIKINVYDDAQNLGIFIPKGTEVQYLKNPQNDKELNTIEDFYESRMRNYCDSHILPLTLLLISEGRFAKDDKGKMYFNGHQVNSHLDVN